ncbi:MAG: hypothetical protein GYA51_00250 [Candidatus Methanofastidiosa archaeon]|nr:hypothetical protein [Candidatus Methanofastidiosa archaeon]
MKVDIIILSNTINDSVWLMNSNCIDSLLDSENISLLGSILIIETNANASYNYHPAVKVLKTNLPFNFNRFLNIGIAATNSEFVALCNNDLIFQKNWFSEILKVYQKDPGIKSFSPIDYEYWLTPKERYPDSTDFYLGYNIRTEVAGWCIVAKRDLFCQIGKLDERFDFYYADNDYAMILYKYNIKHALCVKSHVKHLGSKSSRESVNLLHPNMLENRHEYLKKLPRYLLKDENSWIIKNPKMLEGYFKFHYKWGSEPSIRFRKKINRRLIKILKINLGKILFASPINYIFSISLRMRNILF